MASETPETDLDSMLTIGEAAEQLGVSVSTLRNWDRRGKLVPLRHPINSYRLYPPRLIEQLKGFTAAEAQATYAATTGAEERFDVPFIAPLALAEKQIQQAYRPYIQVHKWFARRPGALFRALLLAEFGEDESLRRSYFKPQFLSHYTVFDPFMGGGTPVLEANRLGMNVVGCDVNPMAHWIVRQELQALDLETFRETADEVLGRAEARIGRYYRTECRYCGREVPVKYFIWVKTQACAECGRKVELFPGYLIAKNARHPEFVLFCPLCRRLVELPERPERGASVHCSNCGGEFHNTAVARRNTYVCPHCDHEGSYPSELASDGPPRHSMLCMEYHCPHCKPEHNGRFFKSADEADLQLYEEARRAFAHSPAQKYVPDEPIREGDETTRLLRWGYREFGQLFNERQLLGLTTLCEEIESVEEQSMREALATVFSDCLRYQNMLARYDTWALKCQDIFSVHGFPVGLVQCENNVLGIDRVGSGAFRHMLAKYIAAKEYCQEPFEKKIEGRQKTRIAMSPERIEAEFTNRMPEAGEERMARLECASSENLDLPEASVDAVITDPPYYDNVQYAELMDFCYVWLRKLLDEDTESFKAPSTRSQRELTGNVSAGRDILHFTQGLSDIYKAATRALKPYGLFAFTYHHNDLAAYVPVAVALCDAGLCVTGALPCPAEMGASLHISGTGSSVIDTVLCARKVVHQDGLPDQGYGRQGLKERLLRQARSLASGRVEPTEGDLRCMALGVLTGWTVNGLLGGWDVEQPVEKRADIAQEKLESLCRSAEMDRVIQSVLNVQDEREEGLGQQELF